MKPPTITDHNYSPHDLLPAREPQYDATFPIDFYNNVAKHLVRDAVRIMNNGVPIDLERVSQLEATLDEVLLTVRTTLERNPLIIDFMSEIHRQDELKYRNEVTSKLKPDTHFETTFKYSNAVHRSYFMHLYAVEQGIELPSDFVHPEVTKWSANSIKKLSTSRPLLQRFLAGNVHSHPLISAAVALMAKHKAEVYNKKLLTKLNEPVPRREFNPASAPQKQALFAFLGIESEAVSKDTGLPKWDRAQIERVNKEFDDPELQELTQALIDFSFGAIVRNNFINAFYNYTVEGRLYGQYKIFGAKSLISRFV